MRIMYQILKTENCLLVVDDSDIKEGDYCIIKDDIFLLKETIGNDSLFHRVIVTDLNNQSFSGHLSKIDKKIIAHLPLNGAEVLHGIDLLPDLYNQKIEVILKQEHIELLNQGNVQYFTDRTEYILPHKFIKEGDKWFIEEVVAKETYKYTEDDLKEAYERGMNNIDFDGCAIDKPEEDINDFIQSLQQPKIPVAFLRTDVKDNEWVGKYIY